MTRFTGLCELSTSEILRLGVRVGEHVVSLGVLLPEGGKLHFEKRFSKHDLRQRGVLRIDGCSLISANHVVAPPASVGADSNPPATAEPERPPLPDLADLPEWEFIETWTPTGDPEATEEVIHVFPAPEPVGDIAPPPAEEPPPPPEIPAPFVEADLDNVQPFPQTLPVWTPHPDPSVLFLDDALASKCSEFQGALTRACEDACIELAVPLEESEPFPLMSIFHLGKALEIDGKLYLVFRIIDGNAVE